MASKEGARRKDVNADKEDERAIIFDENENCKQFGCGK